MRWSCLYLRSLTCGVSMTSASATHKVPTLAEVLNKVHNHGADNGERGVVPGWVLELKRSTQLTHTGRLLDAQLVRGVLFDVLEVHDTRVVVVWYRLELISIPCSSPWPGKRAFWNSVGWTSARGWSRVSQRPKQASRPPMAAILLSTTQSFSWWEK